MDVPARDWTFASSVDSRRRALLTDPRHTFASILGRLSRFTLTHAAWQDGREPEVAGRMRVEFEIRCHEDAIDLFHNGIDGYRAQFYCGVAEGTRANREALAALSNALVLEAISPKHSVGLEPWSRFGVQEISRGWDADGAKVWVSERALAKRYKVWAPAHVDDVRDELRVDRWMRGIRKFAEEHEGTDFDHAKLAGTRAFRVDRLSIKGGFIVLGRPDLGAVVPNDKHDRACDIHERGFT